MSTSTSTTTASTPISAPQRTRASIAVTPSAGHPGPRARRTEAEQWACRRGLVAGPGPAVPGRGGRASRTTEGRHLARTGRP